MKSYEVLYLCADGRCTAREPPSITASPPRTLPTTRTQSKRASCIYVGNCLPLFTLGFIFGVPTQVKAESSRWTPRDAPRARCHSGTVLCAEVHQGLIPSLFVLCVVAYQLYFCRGVLLGPFLHLVKKRWSGRVEYVVVFWLGRFGRLFGDIRATSIGPWCTRVRKSECQRNLLAQGAFMGLDVVALYKT